MKRGILYGVGAYFLWGLFPLYWKLLEHVSSWEIVSHRIVWSVVFLLLLHIIRRNWNWLRISLRTPSVLGIYLLSSLLLSINWSLYIWSVQINRVLDASLGYFITPLVNIVLGLLFLKERLNRAQTISVLLASTGVVYLTIQFGTIPWIALILALSFGFYGLIRKKASFNSVDGLSIETLMLFLPALGYLIFLQHNSQGHWIQGSVTTTLLLTAAGITTSLPLLLFGSAARRVTLTSIGIMQYLSPTLQFLIGLWVFGEPFSLYRLIGFVFIWAASSIYIFDSFKGHITKNKVPKSNYTAINSKPEVYSTH